MLLHALPDVANITNQLDSLCGISHCFACQLSIIVTETTLIQIISDKRTLAGNEWCGTRYNRQVGITQQKTGYKNAYFDHFKIPIFSRFTAAIVCAFRPNNYWNDRPQAQHWRRFTSYMVPSHWLHWKRLIACVLRRARRALLSAIYSLPNRDSTGEA